MTPVHYLDLTDKPATGVLWCPGPLPRSLWVLPHPGARSSDAVVVKLPGKANPAYHQVRYVPSTKVDYSADFQRTANGPWEKTPCVVSHRTADARAREARSAPALEAKEIAALDDQDVVERAARLSWGQRWGGDEPYRTPEGPVWLYRRGNRSKFLDADGHQVGPLQSLPACAIAYAHEQDWRNDLSDQLGVSPREELVGR